MPTKKLTDEELLTGFSPADPSASVDTQEAGADSAVEGADTEGGTEGQEPEVREVTLDGRSFKAPKDLADAFTREINRRDGTRGAEIQTMRERLARLEGSREAPAGERRAEAVDTGPTPPSPDLLIENPEEHQKQLLAYLEHRDRRNSEALERKYQEAEATKDRETARRSAWQTHVNSFYSKPENAVLRENQDIVDLVLEKHKDELAPLSPEDGFARLGELAKARLARITGQAPEVRARSTPKPANLEGSSRRTAVKTEDTESAGPKSLTQALKDRRRAAAAAFVKGGSGVPRQAATR